MGKFYGRQVDLLEGKVLPKVIFFVLPLLFTNLLQTFYSAADMIVVGLSRVDGAVGSIGTAQPLINLILNVFMGFSVGTNIVVAKYIGSGDRDATEKVVHTSTAVSVVFGLICMVIGLVLCRPVLKLMGDEGHVLELADAYTFYYFIGVPFLALSNNLIAVFRAKGDTQTPLFVLSGSGLLNIGLNLFFVLVCDMSVDGVAIATSVSSAASAAVLLYFLARDTTWCRFDIKKLKMNKSAFAEIMRVGIPAGIQGALFSFSNLLIQSSIIGINNRVCPGGSAIIDGNSAAGSIESFVYTATNSVYTAAVTFTSQHHGARKYRRMANVMKSCYTVTFTIAVIFAALIFVLRKTLVGLYVSDELAVDAAYTKIFVMIMPYFLLAFMETGSGVLRGLGKSVTSTVVSLVGSCVLRIIWIYTIFAMSPTLEVIYLSYPVSWGLTALTHFVCSLIVRKKYMKKYPEAQRPLLVAEK